MSWRREPVSLLALPPNALNEVSGNNSIAFNRSSLNRGIFSPVGNAHDVVDDHDETYINMEMHTDNKTMGFFDTSHNYLNEVLSQATTSIAAISTDQSPFHEPHQEQVVQRFIGSTIDKYFNMTTMPSIHISAGASIISVATNFSSFYNNNLTSEQFYGSGNFNGAISDTTIIDDADLMDSDSVRRDYVFDRIDVKIIFITLYSLVFCCCFFGNLLVILVVTLSRRLRSITNFFLANLAVADFCVGVFCVMQNLTIYLIDSWVFGLFLCRVYQFVHSLSYTASIFILVVICMERYFAIIHPITCKQILTSSRLRMVIVGVWITSAIYSIPKFIFSKTVTNVHTINGKEEHICILDRQMFNSELWDLINFGLLYVTPLVVMTVLYSRIAIALWKSSRGLERHIALQNTSTCSPSYSGTHLFRRPSSKYEKRTCVGTATVGTVGVAANTGPAPAGITESQLNGDFQVSMDADKVVVTTWKKQSFHQRHGTQLSQISHSSNNVLRARRGVIRMLIIVVLTFALCNLPYHARKMWQYWSHSYEGGSNFLALLTPLTFLVTYFNSGINPLLYAFLSRNFRKGMRELLLCSFKKGKGKSSSLQQRVPLNVSRKYKFKLRLTINDNENDNENGDTVENDHHHNNNIGLKNLSV